MNWGELPDKPAGQTSWTMGPKQQPKVQAKKPSKVQGRGGWATSLISEGTGTAGAIAGGAAAGAAFGPVGALIGGALAGGAASIGGRLVENKVRDDKWNVGSALNEGAWSAGTGVLPFGTIAGKGAKGFKAAKATGKVWKDAGEKAEMFEIDDSKSKLISKDWQADDLDKILDHPELFKQYPQLRKRLTDMTIKPDQLNPFGTGKNDAGKLLKVNAYDREQARKILLHEIQHEIDHIEGRSGGITVEAAGSFDNYQKNASEARARAVAARADMPMSERYKETPGTLYHGTASGDLRGGATGLHLGTKKAAQEALEAQIGIRADGGLWDGTGKYGDTLLAGKKTQQRWQQENGDYRGLSGFNAGYGRGISGELRGQFPEDDFYLRDHPEMIPVHADGTPYSLDYAPIIAPHKITGGMTNTPLSPLGDWQANGIMKGKLKQGKAKNGYYYKNEAEDSGSISAVVPNGDHIAPAQLKSTFYDSYDVDPKDLIYRPAGVDGKAAFVRRPDKPTELMATHSLSAEKLLHADKLGGIAQPSVGIVDPDKHVIENFGDITLIGNNNLVDPKLPKNNTFASDVYSARQPHGKMKIDYKGEKALKAELQASLDKYGDGYLSLDSYGDHAKSLQENGGVMGHFLESKGIKPDFELDARALRTRLLNQISDLSWDRVDDFAKYRDEVVGGSKTPIRDEDMVKIATDWLKSINHKVDPPELDAFDRHGVMRRKIEENNLESEFKDYVAKLFEKHGGQSKIFKNNDINGNARYVPETMDNVLKKMRKDGIRAGESPEGWDVPEIRAAITPKLKSVDDIYKKKDKLTDKQTMSRIGTLFDDKLDELNALVASYGPGHGMKDMVASYIKGKYPKAKFQAEFPDIPDSAFAKLDKFKEELKHAPTEYFESVPDRGVQLSEFEKALVPEGTPQTVLDKLKGHGIEHLFYNEKYGSYVDPVTKELKDYPTRKDLIKQLMDEDNAKRFNPDGTPKVTAAPEPVKTFRSGPEQYNENGTEMVARERFNLPKLTKLSGGGSDRDVYDLGDGHVLKVAKRARGLAQNGSEVDYYAQREGLIPETVEAGKNYVVAKKMNAPDAATKKLVKELDKFSHHDFQVKSSELQEFLEKHDLSSILDYDVLVNDYKSLRNWGTTPDGKPIHLDGGSLNNTFIDQYSERIPGDPYHSTRPKKNLDDPEFSQAYYKSKAAKKKFGDMDKATMYGAALGFGGWTATNQAGKQNNKQ